jgi:hypothetical protein
MSEEEPKIIIDEGWKAQVEREKEEAEKAEAEAPGEVAEGEGEGEPDPAEATFLNLISSLATQCMFSLGVISPQGEQGQVMIDLGQAKYLVDTLDMLREKTEGNITDEESGHLTEAISELQRIYMVRAQQMQEAQLQESGIDMNNLKGE